MDATKPAMSVVIPLHDKRATIAVCLQCVVGQTFGDFEVVVVDDGSTDGGADIARGFGDARIRVVSQANQGVSAARNRGIAEARAELVALLDADDEWQPGHLAALAALAVEYPQAGLYGTGVRRVNSQGPEKEVFATLPGETGLIQDFFSAPEEGMPFTPSGVALRKSAVAVVGGFAEGERAGEDLDMWVRIALRYPLAYTRAVWATYHVDEGDRGLARLEPKPRSQPLVRTLRSVAADGSVDPRRAAELRRYADWQAMKFVRELLEVRVPAAAELLYKERFDTLRFRLEACFLRVVSRVLSPRVAWELRYRPGKQWQRFRNAMGWPQMAKTGRIVSWRLPRKD